MAGCRKLKVAVPSPAQPGSSGEASFPSVSGPLTLSCLQTLLGSPDKDRARR